MKALIIAAGDGTRLQAFARGRHKCLLPLLGLKIIERVILGAKEAGIIEFVVVTGYRGKYLRKELGKGEKYGVSIKFVDNPKWEKANGLSVLAAKAFFTKNENFVLLVSDHVFDWHTLEKVRRLKLKERECVLAIDRNLESVRDVADATKAVVKNGRVAELGKVLEGYNAYDTGMFFCSPYIFEALRRSTKQGKNSLSDGMRILVKEGRLRAFNIKNRFWFDCDTHEDIKFAEKGLLRSLTKPQDGFISKKLNRRLSTFLTKFLIKTPVSPNFISFTLPLLAIPTFFLLAQGAYPWLFFGGILIQLMSVLDGCDGEIARLKFLHSKWGAWVDPILDRYIDAAFIAGMAYGYWKITDNEFIFPISAFIILVMMLDQYISPHFKSKVGKELRWNRRIAFKRDVRSLFLALGAMTNQILPVLILYLVIFQYQVISKLIAGKRISEETQKSDFLLRSSPAKI
ncbi:MAG: sugar phosphate nucleotidyltransferase [bacterium]|nr:sugar phosphate nucleotidyltransferase [bacterium]